MRLSVGIVSAALSLSIGVLSLASNALAGPKADVAAATSAWGQHSPIQKKCHPSIRMMPCSGVRRRRKYVPAGQRCASISLPLLRLFPASR